MAKGRGGGEDEEGAHNGWNSGPTRASGAKTSPTTTHLASSFLPLALSLSLLSSYSLSSLLSFRTPQATRSPSPFVVSKPALLPLLLKGRQSASTRLSRRSVALRSRPRPLAGANTSQPTHTRLHRKIERPGCWLSIYGAVSKCCCAACRHRCRCCHGTSANDSIRQKTELGPRRSFYFDWRDIQLVRTVRLQIFL
jgi:hypothetical protein